MLLTGDTISSETARLYGLVNRVVSAEKLVAETMTLAERIAHKSPVAIRLGKGMFYEQLKYRDMEDAYDFATERMVCNLADCDAKVGIDAFLNKRKPPKGE